MVIHLKRFDQFGIKIDKKIEFKDILKTHDSISISEVIKLIKDFK